MIGAQNYMFPYASVPRPLDCDIFSMYYLVKSLHKIAYFSTAACHVFNVLQPKLRGISRISKSCMVEKIIE